MFTEILNVVDLLGKPTVVIVTVGPAYCCYCSTTSRPGGTAVTPYSHPLLTPYSQTKTVALTDTVCGTLDYTGMRQLTVPS